MQNTTKKLTWMKHFVITLVLAPFALLWGEVYTRTLTPQSVDSKMNIFAPDSLVGVTYRPNASTYEKGREYNALYQINSLGMRDREYGPKPKGTFRVLLFGDSFSASHGMQIENSLSRQMQRALQGVADHNGPSVKFEVINAAVGGHSPYNYWKAYLRWGPLFDPDVVIVGMSPDDYDSSNAGVNYLIEDGFILGIYRDGESPSGDGSSSLTRLRKWLSWNSQFYILLRNFFYYNDIVGRLDAHFSGKAEKRIELLQQFMVPEPENIKKSWEKSFFYMDKLHEEATKQGVPLLIISIPFKDEIDDSQFERTLVSSGLNRSQTDLAQPLKEISRYCSKRNITLFDPRSAIKKRHLEVPCYFFYDGHWNAEGIRVAAHSIAEEWRALHLPPWGKNDIRQTATE